MVFKQSCSFAILALVLGCTTTSESKRSQELLNEIRPRLVQLRAGMQRPEVEAILQPYSGSTGRFNISGILFSSYMISNEIRVTLFFNFSPSLKTEQEMFDSPISLDVLRRDIGTVSISDGKDWLARTKWQEIRIPEL